ncbi:MAG: beta-ketoacyl synthase N-terminal-like domain-containing protein, partial [Pseudomonadota bacterium]
AHFAAPNPQLPLPTDGALFLVTKKQPFDRHRDTAGRELPRRGAVSSFGFGGVNAHLVLEEAPPRIVPLADTGGPHLIVLSARDEDALRRRLEDLAATLPTVESLPDLAQTLRIGRDAMTERFAAVVSTIAELAQCLEAALAGEAPSGRWFTGRARPGAELEPVPADTIAAARAFAEGSALDFAAWSGGVGRVRLRLPVYRFADERHWLPAPAGATQPIAVRDVDDVHRLEGDRSSLRERLRTILAEASGFSAELIEGDAGFESYGFDSLMAKILHARLEEAFGPLPPSLPFECNTLNALTEHFAAHLPATSEPAVPVERRLPQRPATRARPARGEAIAIIGMAGRYPGAANLDEFWRLLVEGREAITEVPADRWDWRPLWEDDAQAAEARGGINARWGGFLD